MPSLNFIGNSNELNAAYSADGYARIKEGVPGVFVTTHGVGEMSAINGVLGSLCERVKIIHVVGQTSKVLQENRMMIHHSIGNTAEGIRPDHQMYSRMSKEARVDQALLWDVESAPREIDVSWEPNEQHMNVLWLRLEAQGFWQFEKKPCQEVWVSILNSIAGIRRSGGKC